MLQQYRAGCLVARPQGGRNGSATDPLRGAFVGDGESVTPSPRGDGTGVSAVGDGSRASDDDNTWAAAKSSMEGANCVANDEGVGNAGFASQLLDGCGDPWSASAGSADAGTLNLRRKDVCGLASLSNRLCQGVARIGFAYGHDIAAGGRSPSQDFRLVANYARSLCSTAVNRQKIGHAEVLSQAMWNLR